MHDALVLDAMLEAEERIRTNGGELPRGFLRHPLRLDQNGLSSHSVAGNLAGTSGSDGGARDSDSIGELRSAMFTV